MSEHKGWNGRGYLPHFDSGDVVQHVVFRLQGSLPAPVLERLRNAPEDFGLALDEALDRGGVGPTWLADPACADIVADALTGFDGARYSLLAWVVMPNHVHVLITQAEGWPLGKVVKSWKGYTARMINRRLSLTGAFWAPDYFDLYMRDEAQTIAAAAYIEANPVKAGLCRDAMDWRWSSAANRARRPADTAISADLEVRAPLAPSR